jgi:hypothetical protein
LGPSDRLHDLVISTSSHNLKSLQRRRGALLGI